MDEQRGDVMAKRSKAKAKYGKAAKKTKKVKKIAKSRVDPCENEQQQVDDAQADVGGFEQDLQNPGLSQAQRKRLETLLKQARARLSGAKRALARCRRQHPGRPG